MLGKKKISAFSKYAGRATEGPAAVRLQDPTPLMPRKRHQPLLCAITLFNGKGMIGRALALKDLKACLNIQVDNLLIIDSLEK